MLCFCTDGKVCRLFPTTVVSPVTFWLVSAPCTKVVNDRRDATGERRRRNIGLTWNYKSCVPLGFISNVKGRRNSLSSGTSGRKEKEVGRLTLCLHFRSRESVLLLLVWDLYCFVIRVSSFQEVDRRVPRLKVRSWWMWRSKVNVLSLLGVRTNSVIQ